MAKLSTDPLQWLNDSLGNTVSSVILFYCSYSYGCMAVAEYDDLLWWAAPIVLPVSIFQGWGLLFIPVAIWTIWGLLYEVYNPYVVISVNALCASANCILTLELLDFDRSDLEIMQVLMLLLPCWVLYRAWRTPVLKWKAKILPPRETKKSPRMLSWNPLTWLYQAIGHTFTAILLTFSTFWMGYFAACRDFNWVDVSWCGVIIPGFISSGWVVVMIPIGGWILWSAVFEHNNPYILYSINVLFGAVVGRAIEGFWDTAWFSGFILIPPCWILFVRVQPEVRTIIHRIRMLKYRGIEFDEETPPLFRLPSKHGENLHD